MWIFEVVSKQHTDAASAEAYLSCSTLIAVSRLEISTTRQAPSTLVDQAAKDHHVEPNFDNSPPLSSLHLPLFIANYFRPLALGKSRIMLYNTANVVGEESCYSCW